MLHSDFRLLGASCAAANDNRAPETWDEALATDLAILGPVADHFGWLCFWSAPGVYHVGRYDVVWCEGASDPFWELSYQTPRERIFEPLYMVNARGLEVIAVLIATDAAGRDAPCE